MKVVLPKTGYSSKDKSAELLPLVPQDPGELSPINTRTFVLKTDPTDADSATCKTMVHVLQGSEDVRTVVTWMRQAETVCAGLGALGDAKKSVPVLMSMMGLIVSAVFETKMSELADPLHQAALTNAGTDAQARQTVVDNGIWHYATQDHINEALNHVGTQFLPQHVLAKIKRGIRRHCRKPADMSVRSYFRHLARINTEELTRLPPYGANQGFSADEMIDIILFGTPKSWQGEMERQGFDPIGKTPQQVITFMEQCESAEEFSATKDTLFTKESNASKKTASTKKSKKPKASGKTTGEEYCLVHGWGGHSSDDCKKLQAEAKKLKGGSSDTKSKNKTWSNKASDEKDKASKDLASFISSKVNQGVQKQFAVMEKKRKASKDLNAFDPEDVDLKEFDYTGMEDLKIDSGDDVSV